MRQLFFFFLFVLAGRWLWRSMRKAQLARPEASPRQRTAGHGSSSEQIVRCVECGTYVPLSQAKCVAKQVFLCHEHLHSSAQRTAAPGAKAQK